MRVSKWKLLEISEDITGVFMIKHNGVFILFSVSIVKNLCIENAVTEFLTLSQSLFYLFNWYTSKTYLSIN